MTTDTEFSRLLHKVARAYYDDGLTQQQIGERFGISRVKVSRMLSAARERKVVQITIAPPQSSNTEIEQQTRAAVRPERSPRCHTFLIRFPHAGK